MEGKPQVKLIGEDGNIFNLIAIATRELKRNGRRDQADELQSRLFSCGSYEEALSLIEEYCEIV
jgi:uncharacterized Zn finger protein